MNAEPRVSGRTVGRYEIVRQIGQGAMATVHLAHQHDLDRAVALKELDRLDARDSSVSASRLLREARLVGSLSHPNITTVHEYFVDDGRAFIAMEYVEGGSLREHLDGGLSLNQVIGVLDGLLSALTHAEARGVVHRDIKPENVLVTADGRIKVADFGIARAYGLLGAASLTATASAAGTPMYMAPEQAAGGPLAIAADLYAVGVVAFEMLLGYVPFGSGETSLAIVRRHVDEPASNGRAQRPDLDHRLGGWLQRLLAQDPADRPETAAAALDELEEIALELLGNRWRRDAPLPASIREEALAAGATRDARGTAPEPAQRPPRDVEDRPASQQAITRRPVKALVLVVAALLAAAGGYLAFDREAPRTQPAADAPASPASATEQRFAAGLLRVFDQLNAARTGARRQVNAGSATSAHVSHGGVASAYRDAAAAVARLAPVADRRVAVASLGDELVRTARAYDALALAARSRRTKDYDVRRAAVDARERAVQRALERLERSGQQSIPMRSR